ncbi:MAG: hypothetical protein ABSA18_13375 [Dehalococcoidia bacterium]|jgi:hypothetical protein
MLYRIFSKKLGRQVAEVQDVNWPLIKKDEQIPVVIDGKEKLYRVKEVKGYNMEVDPTSGATPKLVYDIWIE